jgi:hypothetical protein
MFEHYYDNFHCYYYFLALFDKYKFSLLLLFSSSFVIFSSKFSLIYFILVVKDLLRRFFLGFN